MTQMVQNAGPLVESMDDFFDLFKRKRLDLVL